MKKMMFIVAPYTVPIEFKNLLKKNFGGKMCSKIYFLDHSEELELEVINIIPTATIFVNPEKHVIGRDQKQN